MLRRFLLLFTMAILLTVLPGAAARESDNPEILWDSWGVPHIYSANNEGLFYAFGWAQAHNHGDLILRLYGQARGRAAEYWGADYLESDQIVRTLNIPAQGQIGYDRLSAEFQAYISAFAAGINDYAAANPDLIGDEWEAVLPVQPADILAHGVRVLRYSFVARTGISYALNWAQTQGEMGSNAWAIGPERSASGNAMLVANPHQPWSDFGLWMEVHLNAPGVNLYGAALVGNPVPGIGFNEFLGWTHTVNTHDGWDLYQLTLTDEGYLFDGETHDFESRQETVLVKEANGNLTEIPLIIRESLHGPVLAEREDGTALALRVVGANALEAVVQWWEMGLARNLSEFEGALRDIRIPMFTIMYADRDGNILHVFNEQVPLRPEGDWAFWNNTTPIDHSNPAIIPGDLSRYLWTEYHPYGDLPRVLNPESGWLQNANEPPWTTTLPLALDPADYPAYMVPPPFVWPRPQVSMRLLNQDESITFEELVAYKQDTLLELTNYGLDELIGLAAESPNQLTRRAGGVLAAWDRRADADSVGTVLFAAWAADYVQPRGFAAFAGAWSIDDTLGTPSGLAAPEEELASLERVALQLEAARIFGGGIDVAYGDVFRLRYGEYDLPANGADDLLGSFRTLTFTQDSDLRFRPVQGDSYIAVVEFGETVRAKVLLAYGNATQAHSPHVGDQLELFARKELRDAWLTREDVEANLERREVLSGVTTDE